MKDSVVSDSTFYISFLSQREINEPQLLKKILQVYKFYLGKVILNEIYKKEINNGDVKYIDFINYLTKIKTQFYKVDKEQKGKKEKIIPSLNLQKLSPNIKEEIYRINKNSEIEITYDQLQKYLKGKYENNAMVNINTLKIDNKTIYETEFKDIYIDMVYYLYMERFFEKKECKKIPCSICGTDGNKTEVSGKVALPIAFYGTTNGYFFENLTNKNKHKTFSMCKNCLEEVIVGINVIQQEYSAKTFGGVEYYIIPDAVNPKIDYSDKINTLIYKFNSTKPSNSQEEMEKIKKMKKLGHKEPDFNINYLFYERNNSEFVIIEHIQNISYYRMENIFEELESLNNNDLYDELRLKPNFNDLYWLLYPSYKSHPKPDSKLYQKDITTLISSILKGRPVKYQNIIQKFNNIFRGTYFINQKNKKNNKTELMMTPLKMNILLTWINNIAKLEGCNNMESKSLIPISNEDINEFFKIHNNIYENNTHRQGLFLLGYLINQILRAQKDKSSTIIGKINFDGIAPKRVPSLISTITEYLTIYKNKNNKSLFDLNSNDYAQMMDRLQGIESSMLSKDEIVFYILSGISFSKYLGFKYHMENKNNNNENENEGDLNE